jgi:iron complex transport system permease protein
MNRNPDSRKSQGVALALLITLAVLLALGCAVGSNGFEWTLGHLWNLGEGPEQAMAQQIVVEIRLPRTVGAALVGALLGLAGALAQGLFRNPLADPYLLGSASGASLGVAVALALMGGLAGMLGAASAEPTPAGFHLLSTQWGARLGLTGAAFVGSTLAVLLTIALARGVQHTFRLLLAGIVVGVVLGALASLVLLLSPESLMAMQSFMLGSTAFLSWSSCALMAGVLGVSVAIAWRFSRLLDGLSLGEATALSLGLPVVRLRLVLILVLALASGTAVAQAGLIAFVGLAAPHVVRALVRCTHGQLVWLASLVGANLLTAADLVARGLVAPLELPVGVMTALLGGGYLLVLMHRHNRLRDPR